MSQQFFMQAQVNFTWSIATKREVNVGAIRFCYLYPRGVCLQLFRVTHYMEQDFPWSLWFGCSKLHSDTQIQLSSEHVDNIQDYNLTSHHSTTYNLGKQAPCKYTGINQTTNKPIINYSLYLDTPLTHTGRY